MCYIWLSYVMRMQKSRLTYEKVKVTEDIAVAFMSGAWFAYQWVTCYWVSYGTRMKKSRLTYEKVKVTEDIAVAFMSGAWFAYEWVMWHVIESCDAYEKVTSHVWKSHVSCMHKSKWLKILLLHSCLVLGPRMNVSHIIESCDAYAKSRLTYEQVKVTEDIAAAFMSSAWFAFEWVMLHIIKSCDAYEKVTSHVWINQSDRRYCCCIHVSCLVRVWMSLFTYDSVMCHICMSHVSRLNESSHAYEYVKVTEDIAAAIMFSAWFVRASMSRVTYEWVTSRMNESCHIWMSHVTYKWDMSHMNES